MSDAYQALIDSLRDHQNGGRRNECEEAARAIETLRAELTEARGLLGEARNQDPVLFIAYKQFGGGYTKRYMNLRDTVEAHRIDGYEITPLYAAPVPQPAVPEAVAKDAAEVVAYRIHYPGGAKRLTEDGDVYDHEKRAGLKIDWLGVVGGIDAAILSATDSEVKK